MLRDLQARSLQDPGCLAGLTACMVLQDSGLRQVLLELEGVEARRRRIAAVFAR